MEYCASEKYVQYLRIIMLCCCSALHWRHNDHDGVSNHQPHDCLLNRLFKRRSKKTSKLRVTGLCVGKSPGPMNSPHKGPVTRKMFPFDDVIMVYVDHSHITRGMLWGMIGSSHWTCRGNDMGMLFALLALWRRIQRSPIDSPPSAPLKQRCNIPFVVSLRKSLNK